jgi:exopolysaccharide production protein ExoQ
MEPIAFVVLFYLIINRIIFGGGWLRISDNTFEKVFKELVLWILDGVLFLWIANQKKNLRIYLSTWKKNWILLIFILLAFCSLFWSENFIISIYKVYVLIACSPIAAYIGITYTSDNILRKLMWFFVIIASLSYGLAILLPEAGRHLDSLYSGSWRGLFFHKNYLGAIMAFGTNVSLFLMMAEKRLKNRLTYLVLFFFMAGLIFLSRSATGIILFGILNGCTLLATAWVKWKCFLRRSHYAIIGFLLTASIILALTNLNFLFGLLNKETTLTGRLPLWSYLINYGMANHPWFGSGFGATWASDQFRLVSQSAVGWGFASLSSDNGFVDIFLHLGMVGVVLFIFALTLCVFRTVKYALCEQTIISFFPIVVMVFVIIANISVSFFLELEAFGWFLMVLAFFRATPLLSGRTNEPPIILEA